MKNKLIAIVAALALIITLLYASGVNILETNYLRVNTAIKDTTNRNAVIKCGTDSLYHKCTQLRDTTYWDTAHHFVTAGDSIRRSGTTALADSTAKLPADYTVFHWSMDSLFSRTIKVSGTIISLLDTSAKMKTDSLWAHRISADTVGAARFTTYNNIASTSPLYYASNGGSIDPRTRDFYRWYSAYGPVTGGIRADATLAWGTRIYGGGELILGGGDSASNHLQITAAGIITVPETLKIVKCIYSGKDSTPNVIATTSVSTPSIITASGGLSISPAAGTAVTINTPELDLTSTTNFAVVSKALSDSSYNYYTWRYGTTSEGNIGYVYANDFALAGSVKGDMFFQNSTSGKSIDFGVNGIKYVTINSSAITITPAIALRGYTGGTAGSTIPPASYAHSFTWGGTYNQTYNSGKFCLMHIADYSNDAGDSGYVELFESENNNIDFYIHSGVTGSTGWGYMPAFVVGTLPTAHVAPAYPFIVNGKTSMTDSLLCTTVRASAVVISTKDSTDNVVATTQVSTPKVATASSGLRLQPNNRGVGIGDTAEPTGTGYSQLKICTGGATLTAGIPTDQNWYSFNMYLSTGWQWKRYAADSCAQYQQISGIHNWYSDVSGTAGVAFNPTLRMSLTVGGVLKIDHVTALTAGHGVVIDTAASGTSLTLSSYIYGDSANFRVIIDRTPWYSGDALTELKKVRGKNGHIDHGSLPVFARAINKHPQDTVFKDTFKFVKKDTMKIRQILKITPAYSDTGRDIGATETMIIVAFQQYIKQQDSIIADLKKEINKIKAGTPQGFAPGGYLEWSLRDRYFVVDN